MAALINIAGANPVDDPSYRYKMPKIMGKVEGRGNGIKTVLVNVVEVAQSLNREPPEVTKFFGTELGAQTIYSEESDRAVVNGAHTENDLQEKIKVYIEKFVLCATCKLPETHYKIKDGVINQKCLACGSKGACDMTHKLTTFIIAQHKKAKAEAKKAEAAEGKKSKKDKKDKSGDAPEKEGSSSKKSSKKDKDDKDNNSSSKAGGVDSTEKKKKSSKERKTVFDAEGAETETFIDAEGDDDVKAVGKWRHHDDFE
jgi:translation initiation factor 5